jgi:hypothetical protein
VSLTWELSLEIIGGVFALLSLFVFWEMATGKQPDYKNAFIGVWILTLPVTVPWVGAGVLFVLLAIEHNPVWLLPISGGALLLSATRRAWLPSWRRLECRRYERRREADMEKAAK